MVAAVAPSAVAPSLPTPSNRVQDACKRICANSIALSCKNVTECMPNCLAMASATPCNDEMLTLYDCLKSQPSKNWECGDDGVAAIRAGWCDREQGQAIGCMEAKMRN
jgi:hypothetical protein